MQIFLRYLKLFFHCSYLLNTLAHWKFTVPRVAYCLLFFKIEIDSFNSEKDVTTIIYFFICQLNGFNDFLAQSSIYTLWFCKKLFPLKFKWFTWISCKLRESKRNIPESLTPLIFYKTNCYFCLPTFTYGKKAIFIAKWVASVKVMVQLFEIFSFKFLQICKHWWEGPPICVITDQIYLFECS